MRAVSFSSATRKDVQTPGFLAKTSSYFGLLGAREPGPQAYLSDIYDPGAVVEAHFHDVDQFQVIVRGGGRLGRAAVQPFAYHYSDAFTPYGPIVSKEIGIAFYTLRLQPTVGLFSMPSDRKQLRGRPGRNIEGLLDLGSGAPEPGIFRQKIFVDEADGVRVAGMELGADAEAPGLPSDAGGQYYLVCEGEIAYRGQNLPRLSLLLVDAGESPSKLVAGGMGALLLMMQFRRTANN